MDEQLTSPFTDMLPALDRFSQRQIECLILVHEGLTSKEIALRLGVSPSTVDTHISAAMSLLDIESRKTAAKAIMAMRAGHRDKPQHFVPSGIGENGGATSKAKGRKGINTLFHLPPIGAQENVLSRQARAFHIIQIAALIITSILAITLTIAGLVNLFSQ